jgi:DNA-binding winged helix-turn-helix (wHTH) protein/tetratricopeptide (TPR) repeat protein/predicted small integral membrane protein
MALINRDFYRFDEFELQPSCRAFLRRGQKIPLAPKTFDVLVCLVIHAGRAVTKDELLETVWPGAFVEESNLSQHIFSLRKALDDKAGFISTLPGRGYQFTAPVSVITEQQQTEAAADGSRYSLERTTERTQVVYEETTYVVAGTAWWKRWPASVVFLAIVLLGGGFLFWLHARPKPTGIYRRMVLANIVNTTGDADFDGVLTRAYSVYFSQSPYMTLLWQPALVTAAGTPAETGKQLCEKSRRPIWVTGSIARDGGGFLLTLQANDCATGKKLAFVKTKADRKQDIFEALDANSDKLRAKLSEPRWSIEKYHVPVEQMDTPSLEAAKANDQGNFLMMYNKDLAASLPYFQKAVELDPNYAMAYGEIANVHQNLGENALAAQYYRRAFELSARLSERDKLVLRAHYYADSEHDLLQAIPTYEQWAADFPFDVAPVINLSDIYYQLGQPVQGIAYAKKAVAMRPNIGMAYVNLVASQMMASRLDDVKPVVQQAIAHHADIPQLHVNIYLLALLEHDTAALDREVQWAAQQDDTWYRWFFVDMLGRVAATAGRLAESQDDFRKAYDIAVKENQLEAAYSVLLDQATVEAQLGRPALALATLHRIKKPDLTSAQLAHLHAELGDTAAVKQYLQDQSLNYRVDTVFNFMTMPELKATLAMRAGHPLEAIASLEAVRPYDLADYQSMYARAQAYAQAGQTQAAIAEYRKLLANPGIDAASPLYPLAHLGLARAYATAGDSALSHVEYEAFLTAWKDADADLPAFKQAKAEFAKLK